MAKRALSRFGPLLCVVALVGCEDAAIGVIDSGPTGNVRVDVDGPSSSLGAWRYYDGVRLLECDLQMVATAEGGSSRSTAEWLEGRVDLYDLRTGRYLASDYYYPGQLEFLWGAREIESGERQLSRPLRYTSYGAFRAYLRFTYTAGGESWQTEHRFDCR